MSDAVALHFHRLDWAILIVYAAFLVVVGFWPRRQSTQEYVIADRGLGMPVFVATLVATWYGGILGSGEFAYDSGLVGWLTNGVPYYVFAVVFALALAPRVQSAGLSIYTIPDKLAAAYDRRTALAGAALTFVYAAPATYVLMLGIMLRLLFHWPLAPAMVAGIAFSVVYVFRGGFLADVRVNTLQFLLMFAGFAAAAWICWTRYGGVAYLRAPGRLPADHLHWMGGDTAGYVAAWFFIALTTLADPGFHQRCTAAKTPGVARYGILVAVVCWIVFDALANFTGLYSRALIPHLADGAMAYPALAAKVLPTGVKGLFFVGMLAPIMASTVSYTFVSAMTVGRDFVWRLRDPAGSGAAHVPAYTRWGLLITSVAALVFALAIPSVVKQWYIFGSLLVPGILLPLAGAYAPDPRWRAPAGFAFWALIAGSGLSLAWMVYGWTHGGLDNPGYPAGLQPMYPGLIAAAAVYGAGLLQRAVERRAALQTIAPDTL